MAPRPREGLRGGKKAALGQPAHRGGKTLSPWYKRPAQASPAFHHRQPGREEARSFVRGHPHPLLQLGPQPSLPRLPPCNHSFLFGVETRPSRWGEGSRHPSGQGLLWREGGAGSQGYPASWNFGSLGAKAGPPFPARRPVNKYLPDAGLRFPGCGGTLVGTARQARWSKISPTPPPHRAAGLGARGWALRTAPGTLPSPLRHKITGFQAAGLEPRATAPLSLPDVVAGALAVRPQAHPPRPTRWGPADFCQSHCPSAHLQRREHKAPAWAPKLTVQVLPPSPPPSLIHSNHSILGQARSWPWGSAKNKTATPGFRVCQGSIRAA